jgi:hypothetical protein
MLFRKVWKFGQTTTWRRSAGRRLFGGSTVIVFDPRSFAVIYGEPETARFVAAIEKIKRHQREKHRLTRLAKQKARALLRKLREQ